VKVKDWRSDQMIRWVEASVHYVCAWDGVFKGISVTDGEGSSGWTVTVAVIISGPCINGWVKLWL
jgi:hypothetical protein